MGFRTLEKQEKPFRGKEWVTFGGIESKSAKNQVFPKLSRNGLSPLKISLKSEKKNCYFPTS